MGESEQAVWMFKGMISSMPQEDQDKVMAYHRQLAQMMKEGGVHAMTALGLLGAELAAKAE